MKWVICSVVSDERRKGANCVLNVGTGVGLARTIHVYVYTVYIR